MPDIPASENEFPFVTLAEQASEPASPAAGLQRLFALTSDSKVYRKESDGTVTELGAGGGGGGGGGYVAVPSTATSAGSAGEYAVDGTYFYICYATNSWARCRIRPFGTNTFNCQYPGDGNGVLYYIGSSGKTAVWTNPHTSGAITVVPSAIGSGTALMVVDRAASAFFTTDVANSYVGIDLGASRSLQVTEYTIRARNSAGHYLRNWKLQGTNSVSANTAVGFNAATWTDIDTRVHDGSIHDISQWGWFLVPTLPASYRYLRILQTGLTESGGNFLTMGEIEFYGKLTT